MFRNYILTAWRNIMRNKLYAVLNIFCLSVGITGAILIALLINQELSYDRYHENFHNIYMITGEYNVGGSSETLAITALPLGPALKEEFTSIKNYVRFRHIDNIDVETETSEFLEKGFFMADSTVFSVFTFKFIEGDPKTALSKPKTVVLTRSAAKKFFGDSIPIGKTLRIMREPFQVTGIIDDVPENSYMKFDALMSIATLDFAYSIEPILFWNINPNYTFIELVNGADIQDIIGNMDAFHEKYITPAGSLFSASAKFTAVPLSAARFYRIMLSRPIASRSSLAILSFVAISLIVIAAVNYTNLATARAGLRAREIGIRKACGATAQQVVAQFLSESLVMVLLAFLISLLLVEILLPGFNTLTEKTFTIKDLFHGNIFLQILFISLATGILAGSYPAFFLGSLNPALILKSGYRKRTGPAGLRKLLVIFQFAISIMLVAGTITVRMQLNYLHTRDLGLDTENRMVVSPSREMNNERMKLLENEIKLNPLVLSTTKSQSVPGGWFNVIAVNTESETGFSDGKIAMNVVDENFIDFFEIEILAGRNFDVAMVSDQENAVIINESAVEYFGWNNEPIGKTIRWFFDETGKPTRSLRVIGVVRDHHFMNLNTPISPLMMVLPGQNNRLLNVLVRYGEGNSSQISNYLDKITREFDNGNVPNIYYLRQGYFNAFSYQERLGRIFGIFAAVCIILSFLGLFGLSSFLAEQRRREVGIRKVLGSSGWGILRLFYREFALLISVAIILAAPVSWILLDQWLNTFLYRTSMNIYPMLFAALISIAVALITVSYHTLKSAAINPADTLRAE